MKPDEIIALDPRIAITLTPGVRPIWTRLVRYYEEKALFKRRGFFTRLAAAFRTLFLSMTLLVVALAVAAALTSELSDDSEKQQKQQIAPTINQSEPSLIPR